MSVDPTWPLPPADAPGSGSPATDPWHVPVPSQPGAPAPPPLNLPAPRFAGPPHPGFPVPAGEPVLVQIGEIAVTSSMVHTPAGPIPLFGSTWHMADYWQSEQRTPRWAIAAAIVGFCVLTIFSLLFLLAKETVHRGTVQVTVSNGSRQYVARIPVADQQQVHWIHQRVNYARSLAML